MELKSLFFGRATLVTFIGILLFEVLSFFAFLSPAIQGVGFVAVTIAALALSLWKLEYGLGIIFAELAVGSKGYLLSMEAFGFTLSIRLALFLAVVIAWIVLVFRERRVEFFRLAYWRWFAAFLAILAFGVANGMIRGNAVADIFFDGNAYLFLGLFPALLQGIRHRESLYRLIRVLTGAILAGAAKALVLLFLFSHDFTALMLVVYRWVRVTGVGEITRMDGNFHRVFFQSHIFDLLLLFLLLILLFAFAERPRLRQYAALLRDRGTRPVVFLFLAVITITLLSWSRSFWLAAVLTGLVLYGWLWFKRKYRYADLAHLSAALGLCLITTVVFLGLVLNIPIDGQGWGGTSLFDLAKSRATDIEDEPAAASRFLLLPKLLDRVKEHPLLGSGFGTTVTYTTEDPRFRETHPDGTYTTFAFEWGYLDMVTEVGVIGLAVFALFVWKMIQEGKRLASSSQNEMEKRFATGLLFGIIALLFVHVTTPYLNHPLGISFLLLSATAFHIFKNPHEPAK